MVFRSLILSHKPKMVVECGVLDGYSTFHIAHSLRFNHRNKGILNGFHAYDLWEDYEYKHGNFDEVHNMIISQGLRDYVTFIKNDAFEASKFYRDGTVDFLHVDISNNGDTLVKILDVWGDKLSEDGMIAFEGGSTERDNIEWMKEFNFPSIVTALTNLRGWDFQVLTPFPSMTLLWKKK